MEYFGRYSFLFATPSFDADDLEGIRFNQIVEEIERSGFEVVKAPKLEDAEIAAQTDAAIGCMVVDRGKPEPSELRGRRRNPLDRRFPHIAAIENGARLDGPAAPVPLRTASKVQGCLPSSMKRTKLSASALTASS